MPLHPTAGPDAAGRRIKDRLRPHRRALVVMLVAIGLTGYASALLMMVQHGRALPGVTVDGTPVGGLDAASVRRVIAGPLTDRADRPVRLVVPGSIVTLDGAAGEVVVDIDATVRQALRAGRSGTPRALAVRVGLERRGLDVRPVVSFDAQQVRMLVDEVADALDREPSVGDLRVDPRTGAVEVVGPLGSLRVEREETYDALVSALLALRGEHVGLVLTTTPPPAPRGLIEGLATDLRRALDAPPVLIHRGRRLELTTATVAQLVEVVEELDEEGRPEPVLRVRPERLDAVLGGEARRTFDRTAVDARLDVPRQPPVTLDALGDTTFRPLPVTVGFDAGSPDVTFAAGATAQRLEAAIRSGSRIVEAGVTEVPAVLSGEALLRGLPTHLLGTFTTYFAAGAARNTNIRLLADTIDEQLVPPGAELSINTLSGPRRCEDGYVLAGAIIGGELVPTCGGGVSQVGTTVYNAAFFAGVPIPEWQPHSFFISRYPPGRESTLNYGTIDVRLVNTTPGWLLMRTAHSDTSITVSLYGVPLWSEVRAEHGQPRNPTSFATVERTASDLRPGARRVLQSGGGGFTIAVDRVLVPRARTDGSEALVERERTVTVYRPQLRIVEVGAPLPIAPASPD